MKMRPLAALVLVCLLAGLLSAGCGSGGGAASTQATAAERAWQVGLRGWSREMLGALDGMSRLFASPSAVRGIEGSQPKFDGELAVFEATLGGCTDRVRRLGPPPSRFQRAHEDALRACTSLERGAKLVIAGVKEVQGGRGYDVFGEATDPLSTGQSEVVLAKSELVSPSGD
jgi:hypothetical protein